MNNTQPIQTMDNAEPIQIILLSSVMFVAGLCFAVTGFGSGIILNIGYWSLVSLGVKSHILYLYPFQISIYSLSESDGSINKTQLILNSNTYKTYIHSYTTNI